MLRTWCRIQTRNSLSESRSRDTGSSRCLLMSVAQINRVKYLKEKVSGKYKRRDSSSISKLDGGGYLTPIVAFLRSLLDVSAGEVALRDLSSAGQYALSTFPNEMLAHCRRTHQPAKCTFD